MPHDARWRARLAHLFTSRLRERRLSSEDTLTLLVVVEGVHDIALLLRISAMLHAHEPTLPDLGSREHRGQLIFLPFCGVDQKAWTHRLAPLAQPEFHLCDREESPETEQRKRLAGSVNQRPGCRAVVTSKRSMANYLHPTAIREASGMEIAFGDDDDVAVLIAREIHASECPNNVWEELPRRKHTRRRNRVQKWLNTKAAGRMTPQRLAERDPQSEVRSWLERMARLMAGDR